MVAINIQQFGGIAPQTPPRYLREEQAQVALNVVPWYGSASSLLAPSSGVYNLNRLEVQSVYKWGQSFPADNVYWFEFSEDADVVQGFIAGDTTERTFFTVDSPNYLPAATDQTLALQGVGSTGYPANWYRLGVPVAPDFDSVSIGGTIPGKEVSEEDPETRVYIYTRVNSWGEEGPPSNPVTIDVRDGERVTLNFGSPAGISNFNQDGWRVYRSATGSVSTEFLLVADLNVPDGQGSLPTTYNDDKTADELGEPCPSIDWYPPPEGLLGLTGLPNGVLVGYEGNDIWFSEPYRPFAWPDSYQLSVGSKIIGLGAIDTTVVVLTQARPYFIQGSDPASMVMVEGDIPQSCVSKRSIVSMGGAVIYASPDGLVALAPNGSRVITQQLFNKVQWQELNPSSIHAYKYEGRYVAFYDDGNTQGGFVIDPTTNTFVYHDEYCDAAYSDIESDTLFVVQDRQIKKWEEGVIKSYQWRSKKFTMASNVPMSCYRVLAEDYSATITFTVWKDGVQFHQATVSNDNILRLPSGLGKTWEFQIDAQAEIYQVLIGQSPSEISDGR